jgi:hypothetical protein
VLLDVGGDVGALLVWMPASLEGIEIEIRPDQAAMPSHSHDHGDLPHLTDVGVLPRPTHSGVGCTARSSPSSFRDATSCTSDRSVPSDCRSPSPSPAPGHPGVLAHARCPGHPLSYSLSNAGYFPDQLNTERVRGT